MTSFVAYTRGDEVADAYTTWSWPGQPGPGLANLTFEWNISEIEKIMNSSNGYDFLKLDNVQVGETNWNFLLFPNENSQGDIALHYLSKNGQERTKLLISVMGNDSNVYRSVEGKHTHEAKDRLDSARYKYLKLLTHNEIKENRGILVGGNLQLLIKLTALDKTQNDDLLKHVSILSMKKEEKMKICEDFKEGWIEDNFSDVHIKCEEEVFYCHKFILAKRSKYFRTMLESDFKESGIKIIEMKEIEVDTLRAILKFLYGGEIDKLDENAVNLLEASQMLQLEDLKKVSETYLLVHHMHLVNAIDMLVIAEAHGASDLKKGAMEIIVKNSAAIIEQVGWEKKLTDSPPLLIEVFKALAKK